MIKYLLFVFLLPVTVINAQGTFNKSYVLPAGSDYSNTYTVVATDSGYLCIGVNKLSNPQNINSFFLDAYGNTVGFQTFGYSGVSCVMSPESYFYDNDKINLCFLQKDFNYSPMMRKITLYQFCGIDTVKSKLIYSDTIDCSVTAGLNSQDNNFFTGWFTPDPNNLEDANFWLLKADTTGQVIWSKQYGGNQNDVALQILHTTDNNIMMSGYSHSFGNNSPLDNGQWYVVKTDTGGNVIWEHTYGNPNIRDYGTHGLIETADSNYILTGSYAVGMSGSAEMLRGRILKIDRNGNIIWSKLYGNQTEETYIGITKQKQNDNLISILHDGISNIGFFVVIQELTQSGEVLWFRKYKYSPDPYGYSVLNSFDFTSDGGYIFAGYGVDYDSVPAQRSWVIKTDSLGFDGVTDFSADTAYRIELSFDTCYGDTGLVITHTYGITAPYTITYSGFAVHDSLFYSPLYEPYIADTLVITGSMLSGNDSIIAIPCTVTDGLGRVLHDTLTVNVGCLVSGFETLAYGNQLRIYPNPTNRQLTIDYNFEDGLKTHDIILYDIKGKQIQLLLVNEKQGKQIIDVSKIPEGNYIVSIKDKDHILYSKQISVTH